MEQPLTSIQERIGSQLERIQSPRVAKTLRMLENWVITLRRFRRNKLAVLGVLILLSLVFLAIFADIISPYDPILQLPGKASLRPNPEHPLGTDNIGRDILSRILHGGRISLWVGGIAVFISLSVGTLIGLVAGYNGGWLDSVLMRAMDILMAFPSLLLALLAVSVLGRSLDNAMIAVGLVYIPQYARLVRAEALKRRESVYVEAAKAIGASPVRILFNEILPNCLPPIIVYATMGIGTAILDVAALSFLGMGALPPTPEWGLMIADAKRYFSNSPYQALMPGLAIFLIVVSFNLVGDGLREALDPRLKR